MIEPDSSLPVASLRRLEALCTRFEEGQSASDRDIGRLLQDVGRHERPWLLRELIALDIELRLAEGRVPRPSDYESHFTAIGERFQPGLIQEMIDSSVPAAETAPRSARYQFLERIGRGGNGDVWRVEDRHAQRTLAIKVLALRWASTLRATSGSSARHY